MNKNFIKIIKQICNELNIKYTVLSKDWVIMLESNNIIKYITGFKFDLNGHAVGNIVDDKYALYEVLKHKNIPIIEHEILFRKNNNNEYAENNNTYDTAMAFFYNHDKNVVIKSNEGTCGTEVFHITNKEELIKNMDLLFLHNFSISLCPYYDIETEYRAIVLNNKVMFSYGKKRPILIGDGIHTIKELLLEFNLTYFCDDKKFDNDKFNITYIPNKNEIIEYNWQFNLSRGSQIIDIGNDKENVELLALKVAKEVDLKFGSVDIIKTNGKYLILEANSGVMTENLTRLLENGYEISYEIYKEAVKLMFKNVD